MIALQHIDPFTTRPDKLPQKSALSRIVRRPEHFKICIGYYKRGMHYDRKDCLIKAGRLYDPEEGVLEGYYIRIRDGLVDTISQPMYTPHDDTVIDYSSSMVIPPLCDHHVHFFDSSPEALRTVKKALTSSGIVRVHDGGSASCHGLRAKKHFGQSLEIKSCGYALYKKGGYGTFLGKGIETLNEARAAIDKLSKLNVDYLKVINSGIVDITTGDITDGGFEKDELRDIIDYAADRGLSVYCHASGDNAVRGAVEAGASTIVHGFSISDDTVALMKERDVSLIPTVAALFRLRDVEGSVESGSAIERLTKAHMRAIRKASEAGVTILPGSDAGPDLLPYGITFLEELSFLQKAGLPIEIILASATTGIIRAGAKADFVVLDGLPDDKASISVIDRFAFSDV